MLLEYVVKIDSVLGTTLSISLEDVVSALGRTVSVLLENVVWSDSFLGKTFSMLLEDESDVKSDSTSGTIMVKRVLEMAGSLRRLRRGSTVGPSP